VALAGIVLAACTVGGAADPAPDSSPPDTAPEGPTVTGPPIEGAVRTDATGYQWQRLPLGAGGFVTGLVIHATGAMYARTDVGGAYRFDRATSTWQQMLTTASVPDADPARNDYAVESVAVSPADAGTVVLSVGDDSDPGEGDPLPTTGRVLRSTDGGRTWTASAQAFFISGNAEIRQRSERIAIDPFDPRRVLLGTRRQGLWVSTDAARTFTQIAPDRVPVGTAPNPAGVHGGVGFVTFDPTVRGRVYAGVAGVGVLRSDDSGVTWRTIVPVRGANQVPLEGSITAGQLLVSLSTVEGDAAGFIGRYDPTTGTVTSLVPDARASAWSGAVDPRDPRHVVITEDAVRSGKLWRTTDGGTTWKTLDISIDASSIPWLQRTDLADFMSVGRLVFDPTVPGRIWFAEGMGVWRTDDLADPTTSVSNVRWVLDSRGIEELVIADVVAPPGGDPIVVAADRQGFRITSVRDFPLRPLVDARFGGGTDADYSGTRPGSLVWIGAEYHLYFSDARRPRAAVSNDGGATWAALPNLTKDMFGGNVAISATDPTNIVWLPSYYLSPFEFQQSGKGLYVTTDAGASWQNLTVAGQNNYHRLMWWLGKQALAADKVDGGVFYLQSDTRQFFVSTDRGRTWRQAPHSAPCEEANACHVYGQVVASPRRAGVVWSSAGDAGLFRSDDRGATPWRKVTAIDTVRAFGLGAPMTAGGPDTLYLYGRAAGDPALGIWRSADDGANWELIGRAPLDLYASITTVTGDPDVPGRVYVTYAGNGVAYGVDTRVPASASSR
jgi:photosystem II stability/assembly factor-like uncharacterized protein